MAISGIDDVQWLGKMLSLRNWVKVIWKFSVLFLQLLVLNYFKIKNFKITKYKRELHKAPLLPLTIVIQFSSLEVTNVTTRFVSKLPEICYIYIIFVYQFLLSISLVL